MAMRMSCKDIIPVFLDDFVKDYDCKDEKDILRDLFENKKVLDDIFKSSPEIQTYRLFWELRNQEDIIVEMFVDGLKTNYDFLRFPINQECRSPRSSTEKYITEVNSLYNNNQRFAKYNVPRMEPYLKLRDALLNLVPSKNVVVEGVLGAGKHWLVLDVCSSYAIQLQMEFNIYWLDMRNCISDESHLENLRSFLYRIDPDLRTNSDQSVSQRIEDVKTDLRHLLKKKCFKNCLLVLRNVQTIKTYEAFNIGCKILLTTRHKSVVNYLSPQTTKFISLKDALTCSEINSLFEKHHCSVPHELHDLTTITNPRKLSIIAESISEGLCTKDDWKEAKLTTIIENSLKVLDAKEREQYDALFIFPKSVQIPSDLLSIVWSTKNSMVIANKFYDYSLVEKPQRSAKTITLPGIYSELNVAIANEAKLHQSIVDYYNIPERFDRCYETTLSNLDCYFYGHIGHHLSKLPNGQVTLFRTIFLDFRFLDQKIRNDSTPWDVHGSVLPTLQVLKQYKEHIVDGDPQYERLVNALVEFLPKVEEKLLRSKHTCLLRIALMTEEGPIYNEALRQVERLPDYVWLTEHGRFHQHRQIINLGNAQAVRAIYLDNDYCLMALSNSTKQQLLLTEVSLEGSATYRLSDEDESGDILEMRVFNNQNNLLTLYSNGSLKLWSLQELHQKPPVQTSKQLINSAIYRRTFKNSDQKISAFYLDEKFEKNVIQLHVAFINGDIIICDWKNNEGIFKQSITPLLATKTYIRCFSKVLDNLYVVCTAACQLTVWSLRNGDMCANAEKYLPSDDDAIAMETYKERLKDGSQFTVMLLIYKRSVWRLRFKHSNYNTIYHLEPEPMSIFDGRIITCGKLSNDGHYLILGTSEGLIVYDLTLCKDVLRSNVSEHIVCLDIYNINDTIFKYHVLCAARNTNFLHVHTLRTLANSQGITWVHHDEAVTQSSDIKRALLEPNVYLYPILEKSKNTLFTIDTKARIHQIQIQDDQSTHQSYSASEWPMIATPHMNDNAHITALCPCNDNAIYVGYNNGKIMNVCTNTELSNEFITEPIDYLKQINSHVLIASSRSASKTLILLLTNQLKLSANFPLLHCFYTMYARSFNERFLIVFTKFGAFLIDVYNSMDQLIGEEQHELVGFDIKGELLFLAFQDHTIRLQIFELIASADKLSYKLIYCTQLDNVNQCDYLTVSSDGDMVALGFKNGDIQLFSYERNCLQQIYYIKSGHASDCDMKLRFSPCKQVLVSCAEQLCFWNVKYMRNNQATSQPLSKRHIYYTSKLYSESREEVDASPYSDTSLNEMSVNQSALHYVCNPAVRKKAHLWSNKRGNAELPELMACVKFVGNETSRFHASDDFTQFYVIDDERVFYHLKVLEDINEHKSDVIAGVQPIRELERIVNIRSMKLPVNNDVLSEDDNGIDVVGNDPTLPSKSAFNRALDNDVDVI